jgi:cellulose biosynthesis protein BcsQ
MRTAFIGSGMMDYAWIDAFGLSLSFARLGQRTLLVWLVDEEPPLQYAVHDGGEALEKKGSPYGLQADEDVQGAIRPCTEPNLDVLWFGKRLAQLDMALSCMHDMSSFLGDKLNAVSDGYVHVILAGYQEQYRHLSISMLMAADSLVLSVDVAQYSLDDIVRLLVNIGTVRYQSKQRLIVDAVCLRGYDARLQSSQLVRDELMMIFNAKVLDSALPSMRDSLPPSSVWVMNGNELAYQRLANEISPRMRRTASAIKRRQRA